jgi:hypothetical protein
VAHNKYSEMDVWKGGWQNEQGRKTIWYGGLFPSETTLGFLQGVSPHSPRTCGNASCTHQIPCSGFCWTKPQWLTTTAWEHGHQRTATSLFPWYPTNPLTHKQFSRASQERVNGQRVHSMEAERFALHYMGFQWSTKSVMRRQKKILMGMERSMTRDCQDDSLTHSLIHEILSAHLLGSILFGKWHSIVNQETKKEPLPGGT